MPQGKKPQEDCTLILIPLTAPPCWIQAPRLLISPEGSGGVTVAARDLGSLVLLLCWHFLFYCPDSLTLALLRSFWPSACQVQTDWVSIQGIFISLLRNPSSHGAWSQEEAWWVAHSTWLPALPGWAEDLYVQVPEHLAFLSGPAPRTAHGCQGDLESAGLPCFLGTTISAL